MVETAEAGASRFEVAELSRLTQALVIRKQRCNAMGNLGAKPSSARIAAGAHADFRLGKVHEEPDLAPDTVVATIARAGIAGSRTSVRRFFERHDICFKKKMLYAADQKREKVALERQRWR